ncbi:MAG TPA: NBR1-Ig-like domain-containing protein [Anaerolineales bacterium]
MKKAIVFLSLSLIVLVSACQAPATPTATVAPSPIAAPATNTPAAPAAPPPTPTVTSASAPTAAAPTVAPTVAPTAAGPCTNAASFVADVTIPDYSHFDPHEAFTKTWRVKNAGTCAWTAAYEAVYSRGDVLGVDGTVPIPLSQTAPGATLDISVNMAAPGSDGKYQVVYQLVDGSGKAMPIDAGDSLWAIITVGKSVASAPPTATASASGGTSSSGGTGTSTSGAGLANTSCVFQGNSDFLAQLVILINAQRTQNGLPALTSSDQLNAAAQNHSEDMACNNFLQHSGWNGSTPESRVAAAGYSASIVRENIYAQPPQYGGNAQAAVTWWMGDQIHRDAILNSQVTQIGVGYAAYSRSDLGGYFTVDFAAP